MRCRVVVQGGDATLGGGARSAWLWWHPVLQGLKAVSNGAEAQHGIGWWRGGLMQRWHPVIAIVAAPGSGVAVKWSWRRGGIDRGAEVKIRMGCGHLSSALCLADGSYGIFRRLYPGR
jgi:hypothetical protein